MPRPKFTNIPGFLKGPLERVLDYIEEKMPVSGVGTKVFDTPKGRAVCADIPAAGYGGPTLHNLTLGALVPDPFKIIGQVTEQVSELMESAIPDASELADIITGPLLSAATSGTSPSSVVSAVEALFGPAVGILNSIEDFVEDAIGDFNPVASALQGHFAMTGSKKPRDGDYIYTETTGILYTIWRQNSLGIPSGNTIFRVPFTVGASTWVAVTLFPAPDISSMIEQIAGIVINLLKALIAAVVDSALQAAGEALKALFEITEELRGLIEALQSALEALASALEALAGRVAAIENQLANAPTLDVINTAGYAVNIKALAAGTPVDVRAPFTWIDSDNGAGYSAKMLIWDQASNLVNVDWREFDYISQDGKMMKNYVLTYPNAPYNYPREEEKEGAMELETVGMCDPDNPGSTTDKKLLVKDA